MIIEIIDKRLKEKYQPETIDDEEQALKEILQEVALYGLASANFFEKAVFHGGTALRILYDLPRFSEDLDFLLKSPDSDFKWEPYVDSLVATCKKFGVQPEIIDKSRVDNNIKKMFLKDNSIGKIIDLSFKHHPGKKLLIKFEIDINPPLGSVRDLKFLDFPAECSIVSQDLASSFAGKCHALLCRNYLKGRDWYDFSWYVTKKISPNLVFLANALYQQGQWANQKLNVTPEWFIDAMKQKMMSIDWKKAASDVDAFLYTQDKKTLSLWGVDYFMDKLNKLEKVLFT